MSNTTSTFTTTQLDYIVDTCKREQYHLCGVYLRTDTVNLRMVGKLIKTTHGYRLETATDLLTNEIDFAPDAVDSIVGSNVYLIKF